MSVRITKHGRCASTHYPSSSFSYETSSSYESDPTSLLGPLLPTDKLHRSNFSRTKLSQSFVWEHNRASSSAELDSTYCPSKPDATVFSTSASTDSLEELQSQHSSSIATHADLLNENHTLVQKNALAQQEVNSARNNQARLENQVYELDQSLAEAREETRRLLRAKKDHDRQMEQSSSAFERERSLWFEREAELLRSIKFATRPLVVQPPAKDRQETDREPAIEAVPPAIQQQISENNAAQARALRAQEKQNTDLRQQILALNQDFIERQRDFKVQESALRAEIIQARELNKGLMEENESYQMLLHEKSMNGEFMQTSIMQNTGYNNDDPTGSPVTAHNNGSINLADELGKAFDRSPISTDSTVESLKEEVKTLKESNTALGLYISKILSRIMENPQLQAILAADYSPRRASVPESPPALISQVNRANNKSGYDSDRNSVNSDHKKEDAPAKPEVGRARSRSLFSGGSMFSRSKPAPQTKSNTGSNRSSSEDDASGTSTGLTSFQEGHVMEDSPRTSYSSSEYAVVSNDSGFSRTAEYEQLTTFDQPFSRKQLQRHASMGGVDRHQRRQTIGAPGSGGGHARYGSESSALQNSSSRRSMMLKTKTSVGGLGSMPESDSPLSPLTSTSIPEGAHESETTDSLRSPSLSISTTITSSSASSDAVVTPTLASGPSTPVVVETGIFRKTLRRMSLFGSAAPAVPVVVAKPEDVSAKEALPEEIPATSA
ncbi:hypothetical protein BG003_008004 [Podila horticola]|nr:hypothetical protein BG003_008004 [Podila horticola]